MNINIRYLQIAVIFLAFIAFIVWIQIPFDKSESFYAHKKEFRGIVKEITDGMMGTKIVMFSDGLVFNIDSHYKSDKVKGDQLKLKEWEQHSIIYLLQPSDSVFKTKNSDTIFVYRKGVEYIFKNTYVE